jgi:hypothetical protein
LKYGKINPLITNFSQENITPNKQLKCAPRNFIPSEVQWTESGRSTINQQPATGNGQQTTNNEQQTTDNEQP